jgi:hypothetical protein
MNEVCFLTGTTAGKMLVWTCHYKMWQPMNYKA